MKKANLLLLIHFLVIPILLRSQSINDSCPPIAEFPFNGSSEDISGNNNHGVMYGNITLTTDRFGTPNSALNFDGEDDFIECVGEDFNLGQSDYTISFWFNRQEFGNHFILSKERWGDNMSNRYACAILSNPQVSQDEDLLWFREAKEIYSPMWNEEEGFIYQYEGKIELDKWYHVATKRENGHLSLYVNGEKVSMFETEEIFDLTNDYNFRIGARYYNNWTNDASEYFEGKIDDIKIYNCALTDEEVTDLFNEIVTSTIELNKEEEAIKIFPTLVKNEFRLENMTNEKINPVLFHDILGREIKRIELEPKEKRIIQIGGIASGIYFLSTRKKTYKIVIKGKQ